jgi:hypothetical protein
MPDPAERIYDAAATILSSQQARADQITSTIGPLGAGAAAAALLLKPALHDFSHAHTAQFVGVVVGLVGVALVLVAGIFVLSGGRIYGVEARQLVEIAAGPPSLLNDPQTFHLEAANALGAVRRGNAGTLVRLRAFFILVAIGLVLEIAGLAAAAEIQPAPSKPPAPTLRLTRDRLTPVDVTLSGQLMPIAPGDVRIGIVVQGHGRQTISRVVPLNNGQFSFHAGFPRSVRPVRSLRYTLAWSQTKTVAQARLVGGATTG